MLSAFLSFGVQYHDTGRLCVCVCVCVGLMFSYCAVRYCTSCPGLCGYADHVSISPYQPQVALVLERGSELTHADPCHLTSDYCHYCYW